MQIKRTSRIIIVLECKICRLNKNNNGVSRYITSKNKKNIVSKIELKKYCKFCKKHQIHLELKSI